MDRLPCLTFKALQISDEGSIAEVSGVIGVVLPLKDLKHVVRDHVVHAEVRLDQVEAKVTTVDHLVARFLLESLAVLQQRLLVLGQLSAHLTHNFVLEGLLGALGTVFLHGGRQMLDSHTG